MTVQNQPDNSTGPGSSFSRIDELCDEFEAAWKSGAPRTISSFLTGLEGDERILLLRELLHTELELHKNSGEIPALSRFVTDFPDESSLISRIYNRHFPGVALAEEETVITGEVSSPNSESRRESDTPLHLGVRSTWLWKSGSDTVAEMRAFARRVVEAGLLTEADLTDLREDLPEGRLPVTAAELASLLQDRQLVTETRWLYFEAGRPSRSCSVITSSATSSAREAWGLFTKLTIAAWIESLRSRCSRRI